MAPIVLLTIPGRRDPPRCVNSHDLFLDKPFHALGFGDVMNTWPVKPFETVTVLKGYANKRDWTWLDNAAEEVLCVTTPFPLSIVIFTQTHKQQHTHKFPHTHAHTTLTARESKHYPCTLTVIRKSGEVMSWYATERCNVVIFRGRTQNKYYTVYTRHFETSQVHLTISPSGGAKINSSFFIPRTSVTHAWTVFWVFSVSRTEGLKHISVELSVSGF